MKITPLDIRQKTFEKAFRGLDKEEVTAFLVTLSQEWEKLMDENKELTIKLNSSEREVEKLREVENSLFKTLKTAEDTGANMIDQATKTAELHMRETQIKSEAMINDAKAKAKDMIEEAELRSKGATEEMEDRVRALAQVYRNLENLRDDLLSDIRSFASDAVEKVERVKSQIKAVDIEAELLKIKRESIDLSSSKKKKQEIEARPVENDELNGHHQEKSEAKQNNKVEISGSTSFFDDIE
ncbi:MAG: DivIVA domain-containing protein [Bacteroidota bacterium]